jgi:hypothetical protein
MSDRLPLNFLENTRGGGGALLLSDSERALLEFALDQFGEPLSRFLLSGLGEEAAARVWLFTVSFANEPGAGRSRRIKVEPDDIPGTPCVLPRRREPLAMLALLHLLIESRRQSSSALSYKQEEVLSLLGWEDAAKTLSAIDEAVKRYASLSYSWGLSREELTERKLSFYNAESRFVSGYGYYNAEEDGEDKRIMNNVYFSSVFVEGLTHRTGFNVDWNRVSEITRDVLY